MYKVFKDHAEIAEYKALSAAKKLAEKEHAVVFHNGEQVYPPQPTAYEAQDEHYEAQAEDAPEATPQDNTDATQSEETDSTGVIQEDEKNITDVEGRYRIESLMNIRIHPALNADIVGIVQPGTVVTVTGLENDWMAVKNGNETVYILYGGGRYATRV